MAGQGDALKRVEDWNGSHKSHSVQIDIDDGYGATAWCVKLWIGKRKIECWEGGPPWPSHGSDNLSLFNDTDDGEYDDWPGLAATINAALDRAEGKR